MSEQDSSGKGASQLKVLIGQVRFPLSSAERQAFYEAVCLFADEVKALGWPPQRMIIALEEMAADRRAQADERDSFDDQVSDIDELVADLVAWAVERYY